MAAENRGCANIFITRQSYDRVGDFSENNGG